MYTKSDLADFEERTIALDDIENQLSFFRDGFPYLPVKRPATDGDGILLPGEQTIEDFMELYDNKRAGEQVLKFVPASGAATRMFKDLYAFAESDAPGNEPGVAVKEFINKLKNFAFFDELQEYIKSRESDPGSLIERGDYKGIVGFLLDDDGLGYANMPKGLLTFHKYGNATRTAFEEHLVEGALYCKGKNGKVNMHLTVSPEHLEGFKELLNKVQKTFEKKYGVKYSVGFSTQKPSTDTIAVDKDNNPFRDRNGRLVFRPGGHGALLENLQSVDADIIFIKNIDNVVPDHLKNDTVKYKKALGGMLISFRERIFDYLDILYENEKTNRGLMEEAMLFLDDELSVNAPWGSDEWSDDQMRSYIISKLDRPIRICGMVRNQGEPGGGPFWVKNNDESMSLQIVEGSQINLSNPLVKKLFDASTHFNPVDIVCSIKNYKGEKFDLKNFRDSNTGFISKKSLEGRELKALELPGLWNGSMSDWNTVFVEVPLTTFNPVKTVNDLLRPGHSEEPDKSP